MAVQRNKGSRDINSIGFIYGVHIPIKERFNANNGIYQNNTSNLVFEPSNNLNPFAKPYFQYSPFNIIHYSSLRPFIKIFHVNPCRALIYVYEFKCECISI